MFAAIVAFLKALPVLIGLIKDLVKMFGQFQEASERKDKAVEFKDALKVAHETKDTRKLEDFFRSVTNIPNSGSSELSTGANTPDAADVKSDSVAG